jgi:hypothetical protein
MLFPYVKQDNGQNDPVGVRPAEPETETQQLRAEVEVDRTPLCP